MKGGKMGLIFIRNRKNREILRLLRKGQFEEALKKAKTQPHRLSREIFIEAVKKEFVPIIKLMKKNKLSKNNKFLEQLLEAHSVRVLNLNDELVVTLLSYFTRKPNDKILESIIDRAFDDIAKELVRFNLSYDQIRVLISNGSPEALLEAVRSGVVHFSDAIQITTSSARHNRYKILKLFLENSDNFTYDQVRLLIDTVALLRMGDLFERAVQIAINRNRFSVEPLIKTCVEYNFGRGIKILNDLELIDKQATKTLLSYAIEFHNSDMFLKSCLELGYDLTYEEVMEAAVSIGDIKFLKYLIFEVRNPHISKLETKQLTKLIPEGELREVLISHIMDITSREEDIKARDLS